MNHPFELLPNSMTRADEVLGMMLSLAHEVTRYMSAVVNFELAMKWPIMIQSQHDSWRARNHVDASTEQPTASRCAT